MFNKDLLFTLLNRAETGNQILEMIDALVSDETGEVAGDTYLPILDQTVPELEEIAF